MMKRCVLPALIAFLLLLGGCAAVGPDHEVPQQAAARRGDVGQAFASAGNPAFTAEPLPPRWWRLYHDAALDALVEQALQANTDLRVAAANLARARALREEAQAAGHAAAGVSAAPAYGRPSAAAKGLPGPLSSSGSYDAGISVSYQLDLFGRIARAVEAAGADADAAAAAYDLARVTVAADTARAFADACSARRQIEVAEKSLSLQEEVVRVAGERTQAGRGTALDVSRARSQLEQLRAAIPPLQTQQRSALYRLAVLTGRPPAALPASVAACDAAPHLTTPIPVGDGAALLRRRPDIRQAERALAGTVARIGVATAELYPSISLGLSAGSSGALGQFGSAATYRWSLGPLISWSLPTSGVGSRIAQARAGSDAALARFDATVLNALRETETALTAYAQELDRNAALRQARDQSELAAQQARTLYRYGRTEFLTTLDADRTLASSESALAASDAQLATNQIALFLALGGGWEGEDGASAQ